MMTWASPFFDRLPKNKKGQPPLLQLAMMTLTKGQIFYSPLIDYTKKNKKRGKFLLLQLTTMVVMMKQLQCYDKQQKNTKRKWTPFLLQFKMKVTKTWGELIPNQPIKRKKSQAK
jgi:hypothetical protein